MATVKQIVGTKAAVTVTGLSTLANNTYCVSNAVDNTANDPLDLLVELAITPGTVSGNKQAVLFAQASLDGSTYQTGPTSGTSATNEPNLKRLGVLPLNTNASAQVGVFSVASAYGGALPPYVKFVVRNESGAAFSAATLNVSEVSATVV